MRDVMKRCRSRPQGYEEIHLMLNVRRYMFKASIESDIKNTYITSNPKRAASKSY
jgi:hypothetical protein